MNHQHIRRLRDACYRHNVADEVERQLLVECGVDGVEVTDAEQRVPVRRSIRDRLRREIAAGAGPAFDHEWLPELFRQMLAEETRQHIIWSTRRKAEQP